MRNFAYRDCRMHMGIPVCKRVGIAKKFAYGDPITHNEVVRIQPGINIESSAEKCSPTTFEYV